MGCLANSLRTFTPPTVLLVPRWALSEHSNVLGCRGVFHLAQSIVRMVGATYGRTSSGTGDASHLHSATSRARPAQENRLPSADPVFVASAEEVLSDIVQPIADIVAPTITGAQLRLC